MHLLIQIRSAFATMCNVVFYFLLFDIMFYCIFWCIGARNCDFEYYTSFKSCLARYEVVWTIQLTHTCCLMTLNAIICH